MKSLNVLCKPIKMGRICYVSRILHGVKVDHLKGNEENHYFLEILCVWFQKIAHAVWVEQAAGRLEPIV